MTRKKHRHLRDASKICPAASPCPGGDFHCELDAGHDGQHKDGCSRWGTPAKETQP